MAKIPRNGQLTSQYPSAEITRKGVRLNWHAIWIGLGLLGLGGGGLGFVGFARSDDVTMEVKAHIAMAAVEHIEVHDKLDDRMDKQEAATMGLGKTIEDVRNVQHWQAADQAADRVAKKGPKKRYAENYKQLFRWNIKRLAVKKLPCKNLDCTD